MVAGPGAGGRINHELLRMYYHVQTLEGNQTEESVLSIIGASSMCKVLMLM